MLYTIRGGSSQYLMSAAGLLDGQRTVMVSLAADAVLPRMPKIAAAEPRAALYG